MEAKKIIFMMSFGILLFSKTLFKAQSPCNKVVVGYWHSFNNGVSTVIKLRDIPCSYNVVDIAFLEGASPSDPTMVFNLDSVGVEKESELIQDIKILKARGVKILASIGGANGAVSLPNATAKTKFVNSLILLIDKFGFEGLDIDIEGGAVNLAIGDNDYQNPTTPVIINLISALQQIKTKYGSNFWITMAPEVAYVQGGISAYSGIWGAYLPLIYGLRNQLNFIHVQYYNTGSNTANDGKNYSQGTPDFIVAMNDMLLSGFKIANNQNFIPLREDQVAFGLPATSGAAPSGGYMTSTEINKALNYLTKGTSYGGQYILPKSFPGTRGIMTWSINWDNIATSNYAWSKNFSQYFCGSTNLCTPANSIADSNNPNNNLKIFPIPIIDKIYFENYLTFESIAIYNINGVLIKQLQKFNSNFIDLKECPAGLYFIRAINNDQLIQEKIIKQ